MLIPPLVAVIAACAMLGQDVFYTCQTMFQASGRGWLAGFCDLLGWYVGIATTTISVTALSGHSFWQKFWVLVLVGGANILGTQLGELTGKKLLQRMDVETVETLAEQLDELDERVSRLERGPIRS